MDIKTAFLNDNLEEEICMDQLIGLCRIVKKRKFVILKGPYMVLSNLQGHVTSDSITVLLCLTYP